MEQDKQCPKCKGIMVKGETKRNFSTFHRMKQGFITGTEVYDYMCVKCGLVESYAENPNCVFEERSY